MERRDNVLAFVSREQQRRNLVVLTLKHAAVVAVAIMLVMWLNNMTGNKLGSLTAAA